MLPQADFEGLGLNVDNAPHAVYGEPDDEFEQEGSQKQPLITRADRVQNTGAIEGQSTKTFGQRWHEINTLFNESTDLVETGVTILYLAYLICLEAPIWHFLCRTVLKELFYDLPILLHGKWLYAFRYADYLQASNHIMANMGGFLIHSLLTLGLYVVYRALKLSLNDVPIYLGDKWYDLYLFSKKLKKSPLFLKRLAGFMLRSVLTLGLYPLFLALEFSLFDLPIYVVTKWEDGYRYAITLQNSNQYFKIFAGFVLRSLLTFGIYGALRALELLLLTIPDYLSTRWGDAYLYADTLQQSNQFLPRFFGFILKSVLTLGIYAAWHALLFSLADLPIALFTQWDQAYQYADWLQNSDNYLQHIGGFIIKSVLTLGIYPVLRALDFSLFVVPFYLAEQWAHAYRYANRLQALPNRWANIAAFVIHSILTLGIYTVLRVLNFSLINVPDYLITQWERAYLYGDNLQTSVESLDQVTGFLIKSVLTLGVYPAWRAVEVVLFDTPVYLVSEWLRAAQYANALQASPNVLAKVAGFTIHSVLTLGIYAAYRGLKCILYDLPKILNKGILSKNNSTRYTAIVATTILTLGLYAVWRFRKEARYHQNTLYFVNNIVHRASLIKQNLADKRRFIKIKAKIAIAKVKMYLLGSISPAQFKEYKDQLLAEQSLVDHERIRHHQVEGARNSARQILSQLRIAKREIHSQVGDLSDQYYAHRQWDEKEYRDDILSVQNEFQALQLAPVAEAEGELVAINELSLDLHIRAAAAIVEYLESKIHDRNFDPTVNDQLIAEDETIASHIALVGIH